MVEPGVSLSHWASHFRERCQQSRPALFLDRDGTIIGNIPYLNDPDLVTVLPGAIDAIRAFKHAGFVVVIVTNQSGIARGKCTVEQYHAVNTRVRGTLGYGMIDAIYASPFLPEGIIPQYAIHHPWRKPGDGMLRAAAIDLNLDLSRSVMVGDSLADVQAGIAAGVQTVAHVMTGHGATERNLVNALYAAESRHFNMPSLLLIDSLESLRLYDVKR